MNNEWPQTETRMGKLGLMADLGAGALAVRRPFLLWARGPADPSLVNLPKLRTIQHNSNNGNKRNIDLRLDCFK
jgi:hypothetical protein